ncbi:hypothetical protein M426DRAFT_266659 [Hypoxylon sp. CI-4A]|nr:hypothetical protein M426DRAFT_266659 [Hypoxylon sp. CI-4A]
MSSSPDSSSEQDKLPTSPEEVTASWLSRVIGQKVKSIESTKTILNATSGKLFLTLTYDEAESIEDNKTSRPTKVCIKGGFNPVLVERYSNIVIPFYKQESQFYNKVASRLAHIDLPKCYWSDSNVTQGIAILDDLEAIGAEFGDPVNPWPVDRVILGVEQLAALHAGTWGSQTSDFPWIQRGFYDGIIRNLLALWGSLVPGAHWSPLPDILKDKKRVAAAFEKYFQTRNPKFRCLVHGDAHIGNTYVVQGLPRFLDWQIIGLASPFQDVAYFVSGSLTVDDRRAHEMRILEHYLDALRGYGGPALSIRDEDVLVEYRKALITGHGWIMTPYEVQSEARVRAMSERYAAAIMDHKTIELLESLPNAGGVEAEDPSTTIQGPGIGDQSHQYSYEWNT